MSTLKEAIESGRRWRLKSSTTIHGTQWFAPGEYVLLTLTPSEAISNDFEIEPEPEKPREWWIIPGEKRMCFSTCHAFDCIRVHDADACDRLHSEPHCGCKTVHVGGGGYVVDDRCPPHDPVKP